MTASRPYKLARRFSRTHRVSYTLVDHAATDQVPVSHDPFHTSDLLYCQVGLYPKQGSIQECSVYTLVLLASTPLNTCFRFDTSEPRHFVQPRSFEEEIEVVRALILRNRCKEPAGDLLDEVIESTEFPSIQVLNSKARCNPMSFQSLPDDLWDTVTRHQYSSWKDLKGRTRCTEDELRLMQTICTKRSCVGSWLSGGSCRDRGGTIVITDPSEADMTYKILNCDLTVLLLVDCDEAFDDDSLRRADVVVTTINMCWRFQEWTWDRVVVTAQFDSHEVAFHRSACKLFSRKRLYFMRRPVKHVRPQDLTEGLRFLAPHLGAWKLGICFLSCLYFVHGKCATVPRALGADEYADEYAAMVLGGLII